jgi:hypothetical protein
MRWTLGQPPLTVSDCDAPKTTLTFVCSLDATNASAAAAAAAVGFRGFHVLYLTLPLLTLTLPLSLIRCSVTKQSDCSIKALTPLKYRTTALAFLRHLGPSWLKSTPHPKSPPLMTFTPTAEIQIRWDFGEKPCFVWPICPAA